MFLLKAPSWNVNQTNVVREGKKTIFGPFSAGFRLAKINWLEVIACIEQIERERKCAPSRVSHVLLFSMEFISGIFVFHCVCTSFWTYLNKTEKIPPDNEHAGTINIIHNINATVTKICSQIYNSNILNQNGTNTTQHNIKQNQAI